MKGKNNGEARLSKIWTPSSILIGAFGLLTAALLAALSYSTYAGIFIICWVFIFVLFAFFTELGLYATILALPLINWNFYLKGLVIPASDLLGLTLLAAFGVRFAFTRLFASGVSMPRLKLPFWAPYLLFIAVAIASSALAELPVPALWYTCRWLLFFYLAFVVVPVNIISDERKLRRSLIAIVVSAMLLAVMGVASLFFQDWQNNFVRIRPLELFGIFPVGDNQNLIAEFLVIAVFCAVALKHWYKKEAGRKFLTLTAIFLALVAIGTFSRAAWIALFFQAILYIWYQKKARSNYLIFLLILLVILSPVIYYMLKLQSEFSIGVSSTENRLLLGEIAVRAFREKPFLGHGSGTFYGLVDNSIRFRAQYGDPLDSHGLWQKILAENGALGTLTFALFIGALFTALWKQVVRLYHAGLNSYFLPLVLAVGGGMLFQFFNTSYYKGKLWLPIGIAVAAWYLIKDKKYERTA